MHSNKSFTQYIIASRFLSLSLNMIDTVYPVFYCNLFQISKYWIHRNYGISYIIFYKKLKFAKNDWRKWKMLHFFPIFTKKNPGYTMCLTVCIYVKCKWFGYNYFCRYLHKNNISDIDVDDFTGVNELRNL